MTSQNGQTKVAEGRELSFFLIPAAVIAAFALMFVGVVATLNHHQPLTASIETVLAGPKAPQQGEPAPSVAVAQAEER